MKTEDTRTEKQLCWMLLLALVAIIGTTGCTTTPTSELTAKHAPLDRIFLESAPKTSEPAVATFVRDSGVFGSAVDLHLFINGERAASLRAGEKVEIRLIPGEYVFGVRPTDPFGAIPLRSIDQNLRSQQKYFYRIFRDASNPNAEIQRYIPGKKMSKN